MDDGGCFSVSEHTLKNLKPPSYIVQILITKSDNQSIKNSDSQNSKYLFLENPYLNRDNDELVLWIF